MATVEEIRRLLEDEIRPLRSKLFSIEEKFSALQKSVDFVSNKYDELLKQIQGSNEKVVTLVSDVKNMKRDLTGVQKRALEVTKAPSTRIRIFLNPQIFLSGYGFRPHASGEFGSESGYF